MNKKKYLDYMMSKSIKDTLVSNSKKIRERNLKDLEDNTNEFFNGKTKMFKDQEKIYLEGT